MSSGATRRPPPFVPPAALVLAASLALAARAPNAHAQAGPPPARSAAVAGTVYDSVGLTPLRDAVVRAVSAERPAEVPAGATTDSLGRFDLGTLPVGQYVATFWHPRLDSLGLTPPTYVVTVRDTNALRLALATPSAARVRAEYCGAQATADSTGVLLGYLRGARERAPLAGGVASARWLEISVGARGLTRAVVERHARSNEQGWFVLCGVPLGAEVTAQAAAGVDTTGTIALKLPAGGVARRDLYVGAAPRVVVRVAAAAADSAAADSAGRPVSPGELTASLRRGAGRLTGTVRGAGGGPLRGARVSAAGAAAAALTDERGEFVLGDLPEGTQTLSARAVGYFPEDRAVDVFADSGGPVEVRMASVRSVLDTIRVVGRRVRSAKLAAFEDRRRSRVGTYVDSTQITRVAAMMATDILRRAAAVVVIPWFDRRSGRVLQRVRVRGGGQCLPLVYIDGFPIELQEDLRELDQFVRPSEIQGMELYTAGQAPAEFARLGACATVVVTTKW